MSNSGGISPPSISAPRSASAGSSPRSPSQSFDTYAASAPSGGYGPGGLAAGSVSHTADGRVSLSDLDKPRNLREMYWDCSRWATSSEVHKAFVENMSTIPDLKPFIHSVEKSRTYAEGREQTRSEDKVKDDYKRLLEKTLRLEEFNRQVGMVYHTYSAAVVVLYFPFLKMAKCPRCRKTFRVDLTDNWIPARGGFNVNCYHCGEGGFKPTHDHYIRAERDIEVAVVEMTQIRTQKRSCGGKLDVFYIIPERDKHRVLEAGPGDREFILTMPQTYLDSILEENGLGTEETLVSLREGCFFLMFAPGLKSDEDGLNVPHFHASRKARWLVNHLERVSEAIGTRNMMASDVISPDAGGSTGGNAFSQISMRGWPDHIRGESRARDKDPNYLMVSPIGIRTARLGGDGKHLMQSGEIRVLMERICAALGCPIEWVFGGLSYSGSDVSTQQISRKLEMFRSWALQLNQWIVDSVADFMRWDRVNLTQRKFRLGQDLPYLQFLTSLATQNQISWRHIHDHLGYSSREERERILDEDLKFELSLTERRAAQEADYQEEMMERQTVAQAAGQVRGSEALLEESLQLAQKVRSDPELYQYVLNSPESATQVFGQNSQEVLQGSRFAEPQTPQIPDPAQLAPAGQAYDAVQDMEPPSELVDFSEISEPEGQDAQALQDPSGEMMQGLLSNLIQEITQASPEQWPPLIENVKQTYGPEVSEFIQQVLYESQATLSTPSTYAGGEANRNIMYTE